MYCMVSWTVLGVDCNLCVDAVDHAELQYADENNNSLIWNAACHIFFFFLSELQDCRAWMIYFYSDLWWCKNNEFRDMSKCHESLNLAAASVGGSRIKSAFYC